MADEPYIIEILLRARDEASRQISALQAQVDRLKASAAGDRAMGDMGRGIDGLGDSAEDASRDVSGLRSEHERLRREAPQVQRSLRDVQKAHDEASSSVGGHADAHSDLAKSASNSGQAIDDLSARARRGIGIFGDAKQQTDALASAQAKLAQHSEELAHSQDQLYARFRTGQIGVAAFAGELRRLQSELQKTASRTDIGSDLGIDLLRRARQVGSDARQYRVQGVGQDVLQSYQSFSQRVREGEVNVKSARIAFRDFEGELRGAALGLRAGSHEAAEFGKAADEAGRKAKNLNLATVDPSSILGKFLSAADNVGVKILSLSAGLRGLMLALGVGLFQQLDTAAISLAGGLSAVGSAAVQAGAALGGALASGAAQAVPALGVALAGLQRIKAIFDAVTLSRQIAQQQAFDPSQAASLQLQTTQGLIDAQNSLQNAYQGVVTAQQRVTQSQQELTLARIQAIRNITDLSLAEQTANEQAQGSRLTLLQAEQQLQAATQGGNQLQLDQARLAVEEAKTGVQRATIDVPRARADYQRASRLGVEGNPQVVAAREAQRQAQIAFNNAQQTVQRSQEQLRLAQMRAASPAGHETATQGQLAYLESRFTDPERRLFESLRSLETQLTARNSPLQRVGDAIVIPFANAVGRVRALLSDRSFLTPFNALASSMRRGLDQIVGALLGRHGTGFFEAMTRDAATNVPLLADAVTHIISIFQSIASAAAPALHQLLTDIDNVTGALAIKDRGNQNGLQQFFSRGMRYAEDFGRLVHSIYDLMKALGSDAAPAGARAVSSLSEAINRATTWVQSHGPEVRNFFAQTVEGAKLLGQILFTVGKMLIQVFNLDSLRAFTSFMDAVLLPAARNVANAIGFFTRTFLDLVNLIPGGAAALQGLAAAFLGLLVINRVVSVVDRARLAFVGLWAAIRVFSQTGSITQAWEAMASRMKGVTAATKEATAATKELGTAQEVSAGKAAGDAAAQTGVDAAETAGVGAAGADAAAQGTLGAAEGGGGALAALKGVGGGLLARLGFGAGAGTISGVLGPVGLAAGGLYALHKILPQGQRAHDGTFGLPTTGTTGQRNISQFQNELGDIKHVDPAGFIKDFFGGSEVNSSTKSLHALADQLQAIKGPLTNLPTDRLQALHDSAVKLAGDPSLAKYKSNLEAVAKAYDPATVAAQRWSNLTRGYLSSLGPVVTQVNQSFESISPTVGSVLEQVRQQVATNMQQIASDLGTKSAQGKAALAENFLTAASTINTYMQQGVVSTSRGISEISRLMSQALTAMGISKADQQRYIGHITPANVGSIISAANSPAYTGSSMSQLQSQINQARGRAVGGLESATPGGRIIRVAEAGHDEVVLTTDPRHASRQRALLGEYFGRAPHVLEGFASGGMVYQSSFGPGATLGRTDQGIDASMAPGTPIGVVGDAQVKGVIPNWYQGQPLIYYVLLNGPDKGREIYLAEQITGQKGLAATDPRALRSLQAEVGRYLSKGQALAYYATAGTGIEEGWASGAGQTLAQATSGYTEGQQTNAGSSFRSFIAGLSRGVIAGAANIASIAAPKVNQAGAIGHIAQTALNRVTDAANAYIQRIAGTLNISTGMSASAPSGTPAGSLRGWLTQALQATNHYSAENLHALYGRAIQESNGNPHSINNWDANARAGTPSKGLLQTIDPTFNRYKMSGHDNIWNPVDNAIAAIRYMFARYGHIVGPSSGGYAIGGELPGSGPIPITAHGGEWIVNPPQQHALARWAGTTRDHIRSALGFDGRPKQEFASGGEIPYVRQWAQPMTSSISMRAGIPDLSQIDAAGSLSSIRAVFAAVVQGFRSMRKISATSSTFVSNFIGYVDGLSGSQSGSVLSRLATAFQAMQTRLTDAATSAAYRIQNGRVVAANTLSGSGAEAADRASVSGLAEERQSLQLQQSIAQRALTQVRQRVSQARRIRDPTQRNRALTSLITAYNQLQIRITDLGDQMTQNVQSAYQAEQQSVQDQVSRINDFYQTQQSGIQARQSIAQNLGNFGAASSADTNLSQLAITQMHQLGDALNRAKAIGDTSQADQIQQSIDQLHQAVTQYAVQSISDAIQGIQQQQGLGDSAASFFGAEAGIAQSRNDFGTMRANLARQYSTTIATDQVAMAAYQTQLRAAQVIGDQAQIASITEAMTQLQSAIDQNTQQLHDNTAAVDDVAAQYVQSRGQFATGVYSGLAQIVQTMGQITGATDVRALRGIYSMSNRSLAGTQGQLAGTLAQDFGVDVRGLSGAALVSTLTNLPIAQMESGMSAVQVTEFENLINSIVANESALEQNTQQLAVLNGQLNQPQQWSTTVWSQFRDAIFNGMGGLMPAYQAALPAGSQPTVPMYRAATPGGTPTFGGDLNVNVTSPTEVLDPQVTAAQISYGIANAPT